MGDIALASQKRGVQSVIYDASTSVSDAWGPASNCQWGVFRFCVLLGCVCNLVYYPAALRHSAVVLQAQPSPTPPPPIRGVCVLSALFTLTHVALMAMSSGRSYSNLYPNLHFPAKLHGTCRYSWASPSPFPQIRQKKYDKRRGWKAKEIYAKTKELVHSRASRVRPLPPPLPPPRRNRDHTFSLSVPQEDQDSLSDPFIPEHISDRRGSRVFPPARLSDLLPHPPHLRGSNPALVHKVAAGLPLAAVAPAALAQL